LPEKPETLAITIAMGWDDPDLTVGKLMRLFRWFDQQTIDGNAPSVSAALLDRIIGVSGFVQAVASVGWIVIDGTSIHLANFDRHNGATAKSRALTAKRVANHKTNAAANGEGNAASVSGALPREEKRREEGNTEPNGSGGKPPMSPDEIIFGYGVPLLVSAGSADKAARSFLGGLRKGHGDQAVVDALRNCLREKPLQPLEWLAATLPPHGTKSTKPNAQEALEAANRAVGDRFLAEQEAARASH
jgi:hypothetical protein